MGQSGKPNSMVGESALWSEFKANAPAGKETLLPDFSYAGYAHGSSPIPDKGGPVFNVEKYGAVPDDGKNDSKAIQKAVSACETAGGGVVLFPKGVFILNDDAATATRARVKITKSGVVLRGAGSGEGGTVLFSPAEMRPEDPKKMWSGRSPFVISGEMRQGAKKAVVTAPSAKGSLALTVGVGHGFKAGDRFILRMERKGKAAGSFVAPHDWNPQWSAGIEIQEIHEVAAVAGNVLRLAEPLMIGVDNIGDWRVEEARFISGIGIESLRFRGAWKGIFVHHRSWQDDSAWRGIQMTRCQNSWIRNCVFEDMNWPIQVADSRQLTMENLDFVGTRGHFGFQTLGTYGILGLKLRDMAGHHHGPSLQGGACCTVYHRCSWAPNTSFDSHANNPYATLHDLNEGGILLSGIGGAWENYPHHLHALVLWNLNVTQMPEQTVSFWTVGKKRKPRTFAQVLIAGVHGAPFEVDATTVLRNESQGQEVFPRSLWLAQLERRLGKIPAHFSEY